MTLKRATIATFMLPATLTLAGCASGDLFGSGGPTTASLPEGPKANPQCVTLAAQMDAIKKEGVVDRVEAEAKGKSKTVAIKRESLSKVAEYNQLNAEFQNKCSTIARPAPSPAAPAVAAAPAKSAAKVKTAAAKTAAPVAAAPEKAQ